MNRILLFCAFGALFGCRTVNEPTTDVITLCCSTSQESKVGALTAGDEVAVFARIEGAEDYFLEAAKYGVGSDGQSLTYGSTVYYPETKQAVNFYAYFPYHTGSFSVPSDQSTAAALKQADLCWASASSTPIPGSVPLEFRHVFARLVVQTDSIPSKIACQVVPNGTLNPATGGFTLNNTQSEVSTKDNELIVPVQPLSRLVLTVSGIEYVFEGSITLQPGQTTTLNLTLYPSTKTATLNGSSTTAWVASSQSGIPEQAVSNRLTLHWANYTPQGATPNKITLTIGGIDYTVSSGITYANQTFTVSFASSQLRYPYTISKIVFYSGATQILPNCTQLLGPMVYKSGAATIGIKDTPNAVQINGLWWATGNLVADGPNGCKIGAPTDCGLYFQFGSLIGWSGGTNGDGTGAPTTTAATVRVKPIGLHPSLDPGNSWPTEGSTTTLNKSYFSVTTTPYLTPGTDIRAYVGAPTAGIGVDLTKANLGSGRYVPLGVGDPCSYYLGGGWRMPRFSETAALFGLPVSLTEWTPLVGASVTYNATTKMWRFVRNGAVLEFPAGQTRDSASEWNPTAGGNFNGNHSTGWSSTELHTRGPGGTPNWFVSTNHPNSWIPIASPPTMGNNECPRNGGSLIRCVLNI